MLLTENRRIYGHGIIFSAIECQGIAWKNSKLHRKHKKYTGCVSRCCLLTVGDFFSKIENFLLQLETFFQRNDFSEKTQHQKYSVFFVKKRSFFVKKPQYNRPDASSIPLLFLVLESFSHPRTERRIDYKNGGFQQQTLHCNCSQRAKTLSSDFGLIFDGRTPSPSLLGLYVKVLPARLLTPVYWISSFNPFLQFTHQI